MGDNVDSDLLYDDFQDNDRKDFNDVNTTFISVYRALLELFTFF